MAFPEHHQSAFWCFRGNHVSKGVLAN